MPSRTRRTLFTPHYTAKVRRTGAASLIGYWPLAEKAGSVGYDASGYGRNGTYTNATLGVAGIGDGGSAVSIAATGFCNVYSTSLNGAFNNAEGTMAVWVKVSAAGVWTDATLRETFYISADANNEILPFLRTATNNQITIAYRAGGTLKSVSSTAYGGITGWLHAAVTWSIAANQMIGYINGVQVGATQTGLGTWSGALGSTRCNIGAQTTTPAQPWSGSLAHAAIWSAPLTAVQIASLASIA